MTSLHDNLITHSPKLIPLFKQLQHQIHVDHTRNVMEKSKLVGKIASQKTKHNRSPFSGNKTNIDKNSNPNQTSIEAEYSNAKRINFSDLKKRAKI